MGDWKYRSPYLQIIFTGFCKHKSNNITPGWDCGTCEWAKPEPYPGMSWAMLDPIGSPTSLLGATKCPKELANA